MKSTSEITFECFAFSLRFDIPIYSKKPKVQRGEEEGQEEEGQEEVRNASFLVDCLYLSHLCTCVMCLDIGSSQCLDNNVQRSLTASRKEPGDLVLHI